MTQGGPYRTQAEDCLQKARNSDKEADKWSWLVLAESYFRLSDLRKSGIPERGNAELAVSEYAPKARPNWMASSIRNKLRELL